MGFSDLMQEKALFHPAVLVAEINSQLCHHSFIFFNVEKFQALRLEFIEGLEIKAERK